MTGEKEKIINLGFNDYLMKPISAENLIKKILVYLS